MGDERSTRQQTTSSQRFEHSTHQRQAEYATERAKILFGCYRRGDANDPDTYVAAVAMVLSKYAVEVIKAVTDPYSGLPSRKKENGYSGMPDVADVREACDNEATRIARMERYRVLPAPDFTRARLPRPAAAPGDLATVFMPNSNPRFAELAEWAKTADVRKWKYDGRAGIVVSYDTWDQRPAAIKRLVEASETLIDRATATVIRDQPPPDFSTEPGAINNTMTHDLVSEWDDDQPAHPPQREAAE